MGQIGVCGQLQYHPQVVTTRCTQAHAFYRRSQDDTLCLMHCKWSGTSFIKSIYVPAADQAAFVL